VINNRNSWVYDIETLKSCFTYTAINIDTLEVVQYVIHKEKNEILELINHLISCKGQIGFNNLNFDYPIIHYILLNWKSWLAKYRKKEHKIILLIYEKAQELIDNQNKDNYFPAIKESQVIILQLDLYRVWHYDNRARSTSLKALEISMNYPNVMDMPIHHTKNNITLEEVNSILEYNLNDVLATFEFYKLTLKFGKIDLRKSIISKFGLKCMNWNNGKIGENLILKLYCDATGKNPYEVKKLRSPIDKIYLKDCIPKSISFTTDIFNKVLKAFENKIVDQSNFKEKDSKGKNRVISIVYKGCKIDYGLGGVHGVVNSGIYESNDNYIIITDDVASLYPNLPLNFKFTIKHLGWEFLDVYGNNIVGVRLAEKAKPKAEQDKAIIDGYKESANIPYGKSNQNTSFLYDPKYTMNTTVSGQLSVSMLVERLGEQIPDLQLIMFNTDGYEVKINKKYKDLYFKIRKQWEIETGLVLESDEYVKMWISNVNNYGCITTKSKVKNKGQFEVDKVIGGEPAYHKDNSFRIIPLAIQEYYVNNVPIEETIYNHKNIYDFCGRQKFNKDSYGEIHYLKDNDIVIEKQQKNVRYYISKSNKKFVKQYLKGSTELINKGYEVEIFNKFIDKEFKEYKINYNFYITEAKKIIQILEPKQMVLF
jgi:hypothetical protein